MKKLLLILTVLIMFGCISTPPKPQSVIERMCHVFASDTFTPEEAVHWDSMNAEGGYLLLRGAERNLDTIVNHVHLIFTTEK